MAAGTPDLVLESVATVAFAVSVGAPLVAARWIAVAVAVGLRLLAIRFSWSLPRIPGQV